MKTVFHSIIDGHDIILGFADPVIDPVETSKRVEPLIRALPEVAQAATIKTQLSDAQRQVATHTVQLQMISNPKTKPRQRMMLGTAQSHQAAIAAAQLAVADLQPKLSTLTAAINSKMLDVKASNTVYCMPGIRQEEGKEAVVESLLPESDEEYRDGKTGHITYAVLQSAVDRQGNSEATKMDGTYVPDFRNVTVWSKKNGIWGERSISTLGDVPATSETPEADLSNDQRTQIQAQVETARVSALSSDDRAAEAKAAQQTAKNAVVLVSSEVQAGVTDQSELTAAQSVYKSALAAINSKYGTKLK